MRALAAAASPPLRALLLLLSPNLPPAPRPLLTMNPSSSSSGGYHSRAAAFASPQPRGGGGRRRGGDGDGSHRIDALGRLLTRVLRHMAAELGLNMRTDGYVRVGDLLRLNLQTFAKVPLKSHTVDEIREAVRRDNKQRFSLLEEDGELLIRANQGHTVTTVTSESLLKPILSADEVSGIRQNVNILIHLDVSKALQDGMKLYISDNRVILTEGFDGVVPVKYFEKIETWPGGVPIPFQR
ncbi:putative tRNA 2'-phosphotransferase isoform X2 [Phragmites australis]|uniref:putative tRNA 2'-phosphotransferase isoform X2 n=1 Tax=Phragmites australis TaxID=29695 RepID=UPI002D771B73|nr:putative tRNA 2'-phosphotransferase isoform X2 [Phragmites australis]